jgi:hypothetical protein
VAIGDERLAQSSIVDLFSRKSENGDQFNHYFDDHFGHQGHGVLNLGINHGSSDTAFYAFEDLSEGVVARFHRLERLVIPDIRRVDGESVGGYTRIEEH